jgi:hypothetical protein
MTKKRERDDIEQLAPYSPAIVWTQDDVCSKCFGTSLTRSCHAGGTAPRLSAAELDLHLGNVSLRNRQAKRGTA